MESNPSGWRDLLPDESLRGWTRVAVPPAGRLDPVTQWHVDSAQRFVVCDGDRGHEWLRYDRELANFILHVEWRLTKAEGPKNYSSGI